jgi:hypothetical protein
LSQLGERQPIDRISALGAGVFREGSAQIVELAGGYWAGRLPTDWWSAGFGCPAASSFVVIWLPDTEIDRFIGLLAGGPIDR